MKHLYLVENKNYGVRTVAENSRSQIRGKQNKKKRRPKKQKQIIEQTDVGEIHQPDLYCPTRKNNFILATKFFKPNRCETAKMHKTEKIWDDMMRLVARYVDRIAAGDETIIVSAGLSCSKQPAPAQRPDFSAILGEKSGSVVLRRKAVQGAKSYIWQYSVSDVVTDKSEWVLGDATTKATTELNNLTIKTIHWFRVAAVTSDGTSAWLAPIMLMVM